MKGKIIFSTFILSGIVCLSAHMEAYGSHPGERWATNHMKVKLADDIDNGFATIGVSTEEAERRLSRSISFFNTYLGSNLQIEYLGRGCNYSDNTDEILCVHAWNCAANPTPGCGTSQGCQSSTAFDVEGRPTDGWVRIVGGGGNACAWPAAYSEYPWDVDLDSDGRWVRGTEDTLVGLLNHELLHALGGPGHHTSPPQQSRVNNGGSENPITHYPSVWEIQDIARVLYGSQTLDAAYISSQDALSWEPGSPAWIGGRLYRLGSVTTGANFLGSIGSWYFDNAIYFKKIDSSGVGTAIRIDQSIEGLSWSPGSIAYGSESPSGILQRPGKLLAVWLANESNQSIRGNIRYAVSFDDGETWPVKGYITDSNGSKVTTTRKTVSTGFDWVSGLFIILWHNNSDQLSYLTMPLDDPTDDGRWHRGTINNYALDGASIACTNQLVDGRGNRTNCLIIWTEMHDSYCMTWRQGYFRTSGTVGEFISSDLRTQCKQGWSVPSVTWHPGDQAFPFKMTWMNPNTTIFSMRKAQTKGTYWRDERSFSTAPIFTSPPSIGSWDHLIRNSGDDVSFRFWELDIMFVQTP